VNQCQLTTAHTSADETLLLLALECRRMAAELAQLIEGLRIKGQKTTWKTFVTAVKSEHKKDETKARQKNPKRLRTECHEQVLKMMR